MCTLDWVLFAFAIVAVIEKQHVERVSDSRLLGASPVSSAMRLIWSGLVCPGSRDAVRLVCFSDWSHQPWKPLEGQLGHCCPLIRLACQLFQKMTVFFLEVPTPGKPDFSWSLGEALHLCSYTSVKPELSQAWPAQDLASKHPLVCAQPSVQKGLAMEINSFHCSILTASCRRALRNHINPSLDHNLNSLAKVLTN